MRITQSFGLLAMVATLGACQPYYAAPPLVAVPVAHPGQYGGQYGSQYAQGQWAYQPVVTYQQPQMIRTEVTVPAYVDRYGRVMAIDTQNGWAGPGGYGRALVPAPR